MATYTDVSVTRAAALARKARQYGYSYASGVGNAWVSCPECGEDVYAFDVRPRGNDMRPIIRDLDASVRDHLTMGDCAAHPG